MTHLRIIFFFIIIALVVSPNSAQQPTSPTITVSKKKVVIDGKSYYLHEVKQGETLYSISKAYNVLQKDIVFSNPDAFEGIRIGQELKIPIKTEDRQGGQLESDQFIYHIVEQGQTIFFLTQKYSVTQDDLYKYNPELKLSPLQTGQVVTIPKSGDLKRPEKPAENYTIHTVKRKETLFSIAKMYDVDLNKLLEENPEIDASNPQVKIDQQIKIPNKHAVPIGIPIETSQTDTIIIRNDLNTSDSIVCVPTMQTQFKVAMLLPLFLAENSPASSPDTSQIVKGADGRLRYKNGKYWIYPNSMEALEFYEGALLALDSLKKTGFNATVYTFDTMNDTIKLAQILRSPVMAEVDLIIGPFYTNMVNQVAQFAKAHHIYYVSPIAVNIESIKNNPQLIQINSGEINSVPLIVDFIKQQDSVHVTVIGHQAESDQTLFNAYRNSLRAVFPDSSLTFHLFRADSIVRPVRYLKENRMNVVIVPTVNEGFINVVASQLHASTRTYKINLYGRPAWTQFVNLDPEYLHSLEFRYATAFYTDYDKPDMKRFLKLFRQYYNTEPTLVNMQGKSATHVYQYALLGYDVMTYFCSALRTYGKGFGQCTPNFQLPTLQSDFHFKQIDPQSGYLNTHLDIYRYTKDYLIVKEN